MSIPVPAGTPDDPAEERRGGDEGIEWGAVQPGQPFPVPAPEIPSGAAGD